MNRKTLVPLVAAVIALGATVAVGQDHGQRDDQNRSEQRDHNRFDDHDQQAAREWYGQQQNHNQKGFRTEDRLSSDEQSRLREGEVLDRHLRSKAHAAPAELVHHLSPAPHGYHYQVIGGHLIMVDSHNRVTSMIRFDENR